MNGTPVSSALLLASERVDAERLLAQFGARFLRRTSGAFHDAMYVARHCPGSDAVRTAQCRDGISHTPVEATDPRHLAMGARALAHYVTQLCND